MTTHLDFNGVVNSARTIVSEFGYDYVYSKCEGMCVYFDEDDKPSCLVGRILDTYGVTSEQIRNAGFNESTVATLFDADLISADRPTRLFLTRLQTSQDAGHPWGRALIEALGRTAKELHDIASAMTDTVKAEML